MASTDDEPTNLSKPQHFSCYDPEWQALEAERLKLGLYTRFDVIRHHLSKIPSMKKAFRKPRRVKPGQKCAKVF